MSEQDGEPHGAMVDSHQGQSAKEVSSFPRAKNPPSPNHSAQTGRVSGVNPHRLVNDFAYHRVPGDKIPVLEEIRKKCLELAQYYAENVPPGRELASALTKIEESMFHANAGFARTMPIEKQ